MPACRAEAPPLYRSDPRRVVSCFLYRDAPVIPAHAMSTAFVETGAPAGHAAAAPAPPPAVSP
jgi:hypothetical protein